MVFAQSGEANVGEMNVQSRSEVKANEQRGYISIEEAIRITRGYADGIIEEIEREWDDGRLTFEVEMRTKRGELELLIDGRTGKILEAEWDD